MLYLFSNLRLNLYLFYFFFLSCTCWADLAQETIYLTWQRCPSTTMTIQWISLSQEKKTFVLYRPQKERGEWLKATGEVLDFPYAPQYVIHRVELNNLQPYTEYLFKVVPYTEEYKFLTAPSHLDKELRFVVGGDMYHDGIPLLAKMCRKAAQTNPIFGLIGGDIAYAVKSRNPNFQIIERWLDWIKVWHTYMVTPKGYLIPVIAAIGNHDLIGEFNQTPAQASTFSALFPMPGNRIYNVLDFDSYLSIFILDSGHANPIDGQQTNWLKTALAQRQQAMHRFAIYHVPAYPSVRDFQNSYSTAIRKSWVPLFEQEGIQAVFEHHDHAYKRTYPLLKDQIHPQGVIYIGDGGWGVEKPRHLHEQRPYLAKFISTQHFVMVTLTSFQQQFKCINDQGQVVDEYIRFVDNRKKQEMNQCKKQQNDPMKTNEIKK